MWRNALNRSKNIQPAVEIPLTVLIGIVDNKETIHKTATMVLIRDGFLEHVAQVYRKPGLIWKKNIKICNYRWCEEMP